MDAVRLVIIGGCRDADALKAKHPSFVLSVAAKLMELQLLEEIKDVARSLGVESRVDFCPNLSWKEKNRYLARAGVGLHTMWCEHFGIAIVEMMVRLPAHLSK